MSTLVRPASPLFIPVSYGGHAAGTGQPLADPPGAQADLHVGLLLLAAPDGGDLLAGLLAATDLVVVDVETTGWLADGARITEVGAIRLSATGPAAEFSALVNPGVPIPAEITALTGITDAMVTDARGIADVLPAFIDFAGGAVVVAHNAPFDVGFLTAACLACGISWPPCAVIDTAVLSRLLLAPDEVADHKLATLSCYFSASSWPCHRAVADARATADVLAGLLRLLPARSASVLAGLGPARADGAPSRYDVAAAGARVPGIQEASVVTAIVLIKADVARIPETAEAIAQIRQVSEVYSVTGEFDLVAMVRVRDHDELADVIPGRVNKVPGVTHTETHIAFRAYSRHDLESVFSIGYPQTS